MPKAQQVTALNAAKRNSGLGNPNEFAKSANGTIGKSLVTPTGGDSYSSGKNYGGLMAMDPTQVNYIVKHHDPTSDIQTDPYDPPDKIPYDFFGTDCP